MGGLPVSELNSLELEFLVLNNFSLAVNIDELQRYGDQLLRHWMVDEDIRRNGIMYDTPSPIAHGHARTSSVSNIAYPYASSNGTPASPVEIDDASRPYDDERSALTKRTRRLTIDDPTSDTSYSGSVYGSNNNNGSYQSGDRSARTSSPIESYVRSNTAPVLPPGSALKQSSKSPSPAPPLPQNRYSAPPTQGSAPVSRSASPQHYHNHGQKPYAAAAAAAPGVSAGRGGGMAGTMSRNASSISLHNSYTGDAVGLNARMVNGERNSGDQTDDEWDTAYAESGYQDPDSSGRRTPGVDRDETHRHSAPSHLAYGDAGVSGRSYQLSRPASMQQLPTPPPSQQTPRKGSPPDLRGPRHRHSFVSPSQKLTTFLDQSSAGVPARPGAAAPPQGSHPPRHARSSVNLTQLQQQQQSQAPIAAYSVDPIDYPPPTRDPRRTSRSPPPQGFAYNQTQPLVSPQPTPPPPVGYTPGGYTPGGYTPTAYVPPSQRGDYSQHLLNHKYHSSQELSSAYVAGAGLVNGGTPPYSEGKMYDRKRTSIGNVVGGVNAVSLNGGGVEEKSAGGRGGQGTGVGGVRGSRGGQS